MQGIYISIPIDRRRCQLVKGLPVRFEFNPGPTKCYGLGYGPGRESKTLDGTYVEVPWIEHT